MPPYMQDGDFRLLHPGEPLFQTFSGETLSYRGKEPLYPFFINECAYYEKSIALSLARRTTVVLPPIRVQTEQEQEQEQQKEKEEDSEEEQERTSEEVGRGGKEEEWGGNNWIKSSLNSTCLQKCTFFIGMRDISPLPTHTLLIVTYNNHNPFGGRNTHWLESHKMPTAAWQLNISIDTGLFHFTSAVLWQCYHCTPIDKRPIGIYVFSLYLFSENI